MKKLFAILMVLTLVAGASFAQVSFGGHAEASVVLFGSGPGDTIVGSGNIDGARIVASGQNEAGTFGGMVRVDFGGNHPGGYGQLDFFLDEMWEDDPMLTAAQNREAKAEFRKELEPYFPNLIPGGNVRANAWWKPIDQLRILIGQHGDGFMGKEGVAGWGFTGPAKQVTTGDFNYGFDAFGGGFGGEMNYLALEITPLDFINVNIGLPFFYNAEVKDIFEGIAVEVGVNMDFGTINVLYNGSKGDSGNVFLFFGLGMIDNVDLHLGARIGFKSYETIEVGLGAEVAISDAFGVKARLNTEFGGNVDGFFGLKFDVLPYFALSDSFTVFFNAGLRMSTTEAQDKATIAYNINPYVEINGGGPAFRAGFRLDGNNTEGSKANWSVPIGITFGF